MYCTSPPSPCYTKPSWRNFIYYCTGLFLDITSWNGYLYNFCFLTNEYFFKTSLYFNVWRQHQTFGTYLIAMLFSNLCLNSMKFLKNTLNIKFKTNRIAFCTERVWTNTAVSNILILFFHWSATDLYYHCFSVFISFFCHLAHIILNLEMI